VSKPSVLLQEIEEIATWFEEISTDPNAPQLSREDEDEYLGEDGAIIEVIDQLSLLCCIFFKLLACLQMTINLFAEN
jgi:hypothetical protein